MSHESEGLIQIASLTVPEINRALMEATNRLDHLKGLRGRALTYDRLRVNAATASDDSLTLGGVSSQEDRVTFMWVTHPGILVQSPGTSYAEVNSSYRRPFDFSDLTSPEARVSVHGWGTDTGNAKGVALHDGSSVLAEVTWNGATETTSTGDWTEITLTADTTLRLYAKGSTAAEHLWINQVVIDFKMGISVT